MDKIVKNKTAIKPHTCTKCGRIIYKGTNYVNVKSCQRHFDGSRYYSYEYYHNECYNNQKQESNLATRVWNRLNEEGPFVVAYHDGTKAYICGVVFNRKNETFIHFKTWNEHISYFLSENDIRDKYVHDADGNLI